MNNTNPEPITVVYASAPLRQVNRYLCDRYLEISVAIASVASAQSLRAAMAADILHGGPTDRMTVLLVTQQIREFFAKVKKAST